MLQRAVAAFTLLDCLLAGDERYLVSLDVPEKADGCLHPHPANSGVKSDKDYFFRRICYSKFRGGKGIKSLQESAGLPCSIFVQCLFM